MNKNTIGYAPQGVRARRIRAEFDSFSQKVGPRPTPVHMAFDLMDPRADGAGRTAIFSEMDLLELAARMADLPAHEILPEDCAEMLRAFVRGDA